MYEGIYYVVKVGYYILFIGVLRRIEKGKIFYRYSNIF